MKILRAILIIALVLSVAACGSEPAKESASAQKPAEPAVPPEIQAAAEAVLGSETEVLVFGDLARTGATQALAINRIAKRPENAPPGILLTRGAIISNEAGKWREVFRVDEHLKNPKGFLGATPVAPVTGWRLQYEQDAAKGIQLYFTPLEQPRGGYLLTIGVRWNPKAKRYQSLDRTYERFLGESPALEKLETYLKM
jgi:hypothetical protein